MIVTVGDLVDDVVVWLDEPFRLGDDTAATILRRRGGSAANVAAFSAAIGRPARFVGRVGDDPAGRALVDELTRAGVDALVERHGRTGTIVAVVGPDGERSFLTDRGAALDLGGEVAQRTTLDGARRLHVPAYSTTGAGLGRASAGLIEHAHERGVPVSIDASAPSVIEHHTPERFRQWIDATRCDVVLANCDEAAALGLLGDPGARALLGAPDVPDRAGVSGGWRPREAIAVVKRGPEPVLVLVGDDEPIEVAVGALDDVRDTTGAGDAFAAGFLASWDARSGVDAHGAWPPGDRRDRAVAAVTAGIALAQRVLRQPGASLDQRGDR